LTQRGNQVAIIASNLQPDAAIDAVWSLNMESTVENIKVVVQETLDELLQAALIPFALIAQPVIADGLGGYLVPFYDSRIHSFEFSWEDGQPLKEIVRGAVLDRARRMDVPLNGFVFAPASRKVRSQVFFANLATAR